MAKLTLAPRSYTVMWAASVRRRRRAAQDAPPATPPTIATRLTADAMAAAFDN